MAASSRLMRPTAAAATTLLSTSTRRVAPRARTFVCEAATTASRKAHTSARLSTRRPVLSSTTAATSRLTPAGGLGQTRSIFIQTENTPNPDALKFLLNHRVLPEGLSAPFLEYLNPRSTIAPPYPSPLAAQLMNIDGVTAVFYGADFITVTKSADANWAHIRPEIFSLITEAITSGQDIVTVSKKAAVGDIGADGKAVTAEDVEAAKAQTPEEQDSLAYDENDSEVVGMIKELLETRIRPAIQEDGGDIEFRGFVDGHVHLKLRGACRTCDSSTVTLKNGIESMLMHYSIVGQIEEVQGVHQVTDPEEEIALAEFEKFEEKLRAQKGPDAAPSAFGKDAIDSVPG
ncbi:HIRA-interacting protein 5 [Apiospora phragmitis]|uniref:HIRA-interacting protein 5 n=1 Tax=Apiospora phragmitis TaxID=2905665 RepID=A0ABR1WT03_9PEZI